MYPPYGIPNSCTTRFQQTLGPHTRLKHTPLASSILQPRGHISYVSGEWWFGKTWHLQGRATGIDILDIGTSAGVVVGVATGIVTNILNKLAANVSTT